MNQISPPAQRLSYSKINPKLQLAWDSTSLGALKRCPRYYQYSMIEGYVTRSESVHLRFGSEYNNALVIYHKSRAIGLSKEQSLIDSLRYAMLHTWDEKLNRPWTSDEPTKTRETLIRSIIWYLTQFEDDTMETYILPDGQPAVELSFRLHTGTVSQITGEDYLLCGYLDRFVKFNDGLYITDFKTTKYQLDEKYFARYSPDNQVSQYDFAGNVIAPEPIKGVIIDAIQLGVTFSRFQRAQIRRTPAQREEWFRDSLQYIELNEKYVEDDYWPQNDTSCEKFGGCPFRTVCSASPEVRPRLIEGLFHKRVWDPLLIREI